MTVPEFFSCALFVNPTQGATQAEKGGIPTSSTGNDIISNQMFDICQILPPPKAPQHLGDCFKKRHTGSGSLHIACAVSLAL